MDTEGRLEASDVDDSGVDTSSSSPGTTDGAQESPETTTTSALPAVSNTPPAMDSDMQLDSDMQDTSDTGDTCTAAFHKQKANDAFKEGDYERAVNGYCTALELTADPEDLSILHSNRSAAYASLSRKLRSIPAAR